MRHVFLLAFAFVFSASCATTLTTIEKQRQPASTVSCESVFRNSEELSTVLEERAFPRGTLQPRERLLSVYLKANQKFPQNAGTRIVGFAMAAEIIRDPKAIEALGAKLAHSEIDEIGESINKTHAAFGIPVRFSREAASSREFEPGTILVGPERIQTIYTGFSSLALNTLLSRIHSIRRAHDVTQEPFNFSQGEEWENLRIKANSDNPQDLEEARIAVRDFLLNPTNADDLRLLQRLGSSMESALNSDEMKKAAKDHRERLRCPVGGRFVRSSRTDLEDRELVNVFENVLRIHVIKDFPDVSEFRQRNFWSHP